MWIYKYFNNYLTRCKIGINNIILTNSLNDFIAKSLFDIVADCIAVRIFKFIERAKLDI